VIDDSLPQTDLRDVPCVSDLLRLINDEGHDWRVFFGSRKGWHFAQQLVLDSSRHPITWILDEDHALESNVMYELSKWFWAAKADKKVGATGGVYYLAGDHHRFVLPSNWAERIDCNGEIVIDKEKGVSYGNQLQMSVHPDALPKPTQHLCGSIMYRTDLGRRWGFNLGLSYVARTADNDFSYQFFLAGYKCLVVPTAIIWHFPSKNYGNMPKDSLEYKRCCEKDRAIFEERVRQWNALKA
jgi:GT2 family glycosyltransferase